MRSSDVGGSQTRCNTSRNPREWTVRGSVTLPTALAGLGLINEYELVGHPKVACHGPTVFAGQPKRLELTLGRRQEFGSGRWRYRTNARLIWGAPRTLQFYFSTPNFGGTDHPSRGFPAACPQAHDGSLTA